MLKKIPDIIIYQAKNGAIELKGDVKKETIWASQAQVVELFDVDQSVVSRHINKIFRDQEVDKKSNMQKMHIANSDKPVNFYSLDVILAVGYRTNSKIAIEFRKWATKTLRTHIIDGYTINSKRIQLNYQKFLQAVEDIKKVSMDNTSIETNDILELIKTFANTWFSLDAYDKSSLPSFGVNKSQVKITSKELKNDLLELKKDLINKKEATDIFGIEKTKEALDGIIGNIFQSFDGKDLYQTLEEKAAHLLYFMIKNHPFIDGNKRSGAFAFIWFLQKSNIDFRSKITPEALTAITLLIAESNPKEKERMVGLLLLLLK